jgi:hypothetical protein
MSKITWTVELPRQVAEEDRCSVQVDAETLEEAIRNAAPKLGLSGTHFAGKTFLVRTRVEVLPPTNLPLKSV